MQVTSIIKGASKSHILLYFGRVDRLEWNPSKFQWPSNKGSISFLYYNVRLGHEMLQEKYSVIDVIGHKW